ncbi:hypothetical protein ACFTWH_04005 [Streptomyces sp. NPDC057011]|uniref:hypothetical protein n=1 Tax=unclassified Streptomyces TaxID=2593676 RepID=UPI0036334AC0
MTEPLYYVDRSDIDESESTMTTVAVHPDAASMELHMELGGPKFRAFGPLIRMRSIDVYGRPGPVVADLLRQKAEMLGGGTVTLHSLQAGFSRPYPPGNRLGLHAGVPGPAPAARPKGG